MGYIRHHAIVVTAYNIKDIDLVRNKAIELFGMLVSNIVQSNVNGYISFFIAPDGSKEGWNDSNEGDDNRAAFIEFIKDNKDGIDYVELFYGDDEGDAGIINHN